MKNISYIAIGSMLLLLFISISCKQGQEKAKTEEEEVLPEDIVEMRLDQERLANIETGSLVVKSLKGTTRVNGILCVSPQHFATVCVPMGGFVRNISLLPGSEVKKGQVLATVENQEFIEIQRAYCEARNKLEFAEAEYKRHNELYKEEVYSQKSLQQSTSEYKSLKAEVKALEQKLAFIGIHPARLDEDNISKSIVITSPIDGAIKSVNANLGKFVTPGEAMFEIIDNNDLILELTLFEKDADKVSQGQPIRFFVNNETEQHMATVYQTGKSVGADKTLKIYARVTTSCKHLFPGMYINAQVETSSRDLYALPAESVVNFEDKDYIFIYKRPKVENGKKFSEYQMVEVKKIISTDGMVGIEMPSDIDPNQTKVVIKGAYQLLSAKKNAGDMAC